MHQQFVKCAENNQRKLTLRKIKEKEKFWTLKHLGSEKSDSDSGLSEESKRVKF
jgi:hypothetical protein